MPKDTISAEARRLHTHSIVVDLHVDPIIQHLLFNYDIRVEHNATWSPDKRNRLYRFLIKLGEKKNLHKPFFNHIDIPRMQKGGFTFGSFSIHYWPVQTENGWEATLRQLNYLQQVVETDDRLIAATQPEDIRTAFSQNKIAVFAGIEGVHCLGKGGRQTQQKRLQRLETVFANFGVRYLTLTHFSKNDAATPCMGIGSHEHAGLTPFGKTLIEKMNDIGMIVDLAHVNNRGVLDACDVSKKPVIVSHTGVKAVHEHPRNLSNEAIKAVAETGGVIGIMFATNFLSSETTNPSADILIRHINHIIQTVGDDHVALGSDFDGWIPRIPEDMNDATDLPVLTQHMLDSGYRESRIKKILGENFLSVWKEVLS